LLKVFCTLFLDEPISVQKYHREDLDSDVDREEELKLTKEEPEVVDDRKSSEDEVLSEDTFMKREVSSKPKAKKVSILQEVILEKNIEDTIPKHISKKKSKVGITEKAIIKHSEEKEYYLDAEKIKPRRAMNNEEEKSESVEEVKVEKKSKIRYKASKPSDAETEERRKKRNSEIKKDFFKQHIVQADSEDLDISNKQKDIIDLLKVSFKRHKGNRSLIIERELTRLKEIPMKYKEVEVSFNTPIDDLDICPHLGEKVYKTSESIIWKQVDIAAMKEEKKTILALKRERKLMENKQIVMSGDGHVIGDRNVHKRKAIKELDEGRVKILYNRRSGAMSVYAVNIERDGEFIQQLKGEKMVFIL